MKFDDLDKKLRVYETAHDFCVPPNIYMIARIDGRSFTKLTKVTYDFERPFDNKFRDMMIQTVLHLMNCGFKVIYGFTESDEISLLFDINNSLFSRKLRKYNSVLAGEASAKFSTLLGAVGAFDCRISQLPRQEDVIDYFRWRNEDAHRNALNAHCYWLLRKQGKSSIKATNAIEGQSTAFKNELLFNNGINFNNLPNWQKRGIGFYWGSVMKEGWNPIKQQKEQTYRNEIKIDMNLPMGDDYNKYVFNILKHHNN